MRRYHNVEDFSDGLSSGLEYRPALGMFYIGCAAMSFLFCYVSGPASRLAFADWSVVFGSGALALLIKGVFYFKKSSDGVSAGLANSMTLAEPSDAPAIPRENESLVLHFGLLLKTFGASVFLVWPVLVFLAVVSLDELGEHLRGTVGILGLVWFAGWAIAAKCKSSYY